jgi:hypothetical protein
MLLWTMIDREAPIFWTVIALEAVISSTVIAFPRGSGIG